MKTLDVLGTGAAQLLKGRPPKPAVARQLGGSAGPPRDPWLSDQARRDEVNARKDGRWLGPRRKGWVRGE